MHRLLAISLLFATSLPAFAHRLHVSAKVEGEQVRVEAYYDDDTPAQQAKVTLLQGDVVVAEGPTDDKGVWYCAKPIAGTYIVRAASFGHTAQETLPVTDPSVPTLTAAPDPPETTDREEKTRTPWRRIGMGLGLLLGVSLFWLLARRSGDRKFPQPQ